MSSKLIFSYHFRAQRRKTDRSASALILFLPLSFFSDKVYVPFCTLLRDMLVSTLSSFRKDPNLLVKIKSKTKSKLKLAKRKLKIKIKPNDSHSDLDFNLKLDLSDIKRLVSGGYTRVLLRYCVLLWQRVNLDTKISSATVTSLTTLTFFPQSLAPGDPGEPGEAGPGPSQRVPEEAGPPPRDQGEAAPGPPCSKPGPGPRGDPDQDPRPGLDDLPGNLVKTQLDQTQDTPSSYKTSISFGPSGLATHCIGMSLSFSPRSNKTPQDQECQPDRGLDMDMVVNLMFVILSSSWTPAFTNVIIS